MIPAKLKKTARVNKGQVTRAYHQRLDISIVDITLHRRLYSYLISLFMDGCFKNQISPLSHSILGGLPSLAFVPGLLQAYTCCRYCELSQIGVHLIKTNSPFVIKSSKSDHIRSENRFSLQHPDQLRRINPATKILVISYDSYKNSIIKAKRPFKFIQIMDILDCTHIWRHIEASWQYSRGVALADISNHLGHVSHSTTQKYIHRDWEV